MGIYYKKNGKYYNKLNQRVIDKTKISAWSGIYIPPAYKRINYYWNKSYLATGIDQAGRKQYIYHPSWSNKRESKKKNQLKKLGLLYDRYNRKINNDMYHSKSSKERMIATMLKLMDVCGFRGGNEKYENLYGSFGLSTLHKKHIHPSGKEVKIEFIGKKGVLNTCVVKDPSLVKILKNLYNSCKSSKDYLFTYKEGGSRHKIHLYDLNDYLKVFGITCKDLRMWNANIIFLRNFANVAKTINKEYNKNHKGNYSVKHKWRKRVIQETIKKTAVLLHHTATVCKKSYLNKDLLDDIENKQTMFKNVWNTKLAPEQFFSNYVTNKKM